jgi:glycosyltransferase involved in cell wall biosynthesis
MILSSRDLKNKKVDAEKTKKNKVVTVKDIQGILKTKDQAETWRILIEKGLLDGESLFREYSGVDNCFLGESLYIIGAGPPLKPFIEKIGWDFLEGKNTISINHVIEDWDRAKWHFFLDIRFKQITTYNLDDFKGTIFAQCTTGMKPSERVKLFYCKNDFPGRRFKDGLYSPGFSGLAALNLAILTGADPIYLIGFGNGETGNSQGYHYKEDYTGEIKEKERFDKFCRVYKLFEKFKEYSHRVVHVTDGDDIPTFKNKVKIDEFKKEIEKRKSIEISQRPRIIHYSFTEDINKHAEITRHIVNEGIGRHFLLDIKSGNVPPADLYILEHFLSTDKYINAFPFPEKAIDIIHTVNCIPRKPFKKVVALTESWKSHLKKYFVQNIEMIHGGIDLEPYNNIVPSNNKAIGRITRWSPGKIHPEWNKTIKGILDSVEGANAIIYTHLDQADSRPPLYDIRIDYNSGCQIDMFKGNFLKRLSVYIHMNGSFKETLSFGIIEAMATGLPIIYLTEKTGVIEEVTGPAGLRCETPEEVKQKTILLLNDKKMRKEYSLKAKEQAKKFDKNIMLEKFDNLILECLQR